MTTFEKQLHEPIDLCSIYFPVDNPPPEQVEDWRRMRELRNPFSCTITRKIGNTIYIIDTECAGDEPLPHKVKRLFFSDKEAS